MDRYTYNFEKLEIWNLAISLSVNIYNVTKDFPNEEKFGLTNQLRRASNSISANIAEGSSRTTSKDKSRFIQVSYGSAIETLNHLILSYRLNFISEQELEAFREEISQLTNKLNAFNNSILRSS